MRSRKRSGRIRTFISNQRGSGKNDHRRGANSEVGLVPQTSEVEGRSPIEPGLADFLSAPRVKRSSRLDFSCLSLSVLPEYLERLLIDRPQHAGKQTGALNGT